MAVRQGRGWRHQVRRCATERHAHFALRAESDASADRDEDRHGVDHQGLCQELVHDFHRSAWADALELRVALPQQALPQRDELLTAHPGLAWLPEPQPPGVAPEELQLDARLELPDESESGELESQSGPAARASLRVHLALPLAHR